MGDYLTDWYFVNRSMHIISVMAWMAGLFYLPRLFVYHVEEVGSGNPTDRLFQTMERRLIKAIMNPAAISTWVFGLCLVFTPGIVDWGSYWPWFKAFCVLVMTWFHFWCDWRRKEFAAGTNRLTGRAFRAMNELPTVLMFVIVFAVILKF
ncbi:CopD family protein [Rhodobacter sp. Har01]|uniref:CopD family protein n=1 Tax=Rhodobacter sp. Har01 TaxID=2883999 RepID=UPI001D098363|nr:CopD family protein [Rhodobacter sp. Har01]MCB6177993.1 CopD family protein [Rhodobacter sp. Har01]